MDAFVQAIKQYPGQQQVTRRVRVMVPGKHFPQLQAAEKAVSYWGTAVEFQERRKFPRHLKAWGAEHTVRGQNLLERAQHATAAAEPAVDRLGRW